MSNCLVTALKKKKILGELSKTFLLCLRLEHALPPLLKTQMNKGLMWLHFGIDIIQDSTRNGVHRTCDELCNRIDCLEHKCVKHMLLVSHRIA